MPENQKDNKKNILIIVAAVVVVALIVVGIVSLPALRKGEKTAAKAGIGMLRTKPIYVQSGVLNYTFTEIGLENEDFVKAQEQIEGLFQKADSEIDTYIKTKNPNLQNETDAKLLDAKMREVLEKLQKDSNAIIFPLKKKGEMAIATVALEKNMTAVLDKGVVVCGAEDITDAVIAKMKDPNLKMPEDAKLKELSNKSRIGYFNKEVLLNLPAFQDAAMKIEQYKAEIAKQLQEKIEKENLSDEDKMRLLQIYDKGLQEFTMNIYAPLYRQADRSLKKVAEEQKIDLVLDSVNILYGGRNITDPVMDDFNGTGSSGASGIPGAAPAASPSR